jgi:hypothetical protein
MIFVRREIVGAHPCERGGRLYVADRRDKIWSLALGEAGPDDFLALAP